MKPKLQLVHLPLCILLTVSTAAAQQQATPQPHSSNSSASSAAARRQVAVTFDDLPFIVHNRNDTGRIVNLTRKLLTTITTLRIPAVGFVNEAQLGIDGSGRPARLQILRMWVDAGLELGNHTYSHPDLHKIPLAEFKENVILGEKVTSNLLRGKNMKLRYFRHPFLHTGRDLETKRDFELFLAGRGYRVAPITIDNSDWIFAKAYGVAAEQRDTEMMRRISSTFLSYMESYFAYYERQSTALFGREIKQTLLLHANSLNADTFEQLARMMKRRGYEFITLDEALTDSAYTSPDTFTGPGGITWLHRWAITQGKKPPFFDGEPRTPEFVLKLAGITEG